MKKFSKEHIITRDELVEKLKEAKEAADKEWDLVNAAMDLLNGKLRAYNKILEEINNFREDVTGQMDDYISEKSEKWADSDAGEAYSSWYNDWESLDLSEVEPLEMPDIPDMAHPEEIEQLQDAPV